MKKVEKGKLKIESSVGMQRLPWNNEFVSVRLMLADSQFSIFNSQFSPGFHNAC